MEFEVVTRIFRVRAERKLEKGKGETTRERRMSEKSEKVRKSSLSYDIL